MAPSFQPSRIQLLRSGVDALVSRKSCARGAFPLAVILGVSHLPGFFFSQKL